MFESNSRFSNVVFFVISAASLALGLVVRQSEEVRFAQRFVQAHIRELLGKTPEPSPKLSLFLYTDESAAVVQSQAKEQCNDSSDMSLTQLARVLRLISTRHPKAIIIDKLFQKQLLSQEQIREFRSIVRGIKSPVYVGATRYGGAAFAAATVRETLSQRFFRTVTRFPERENVFFGPISPLDELASGVGEITAPDFDKFLPFEGNAQGIVPMLSLSFVRELNLENGLRTEYGKIPLTSDGRVIVDVLPEERFQRNDIKNFLCFVSDILSEECQKILGVSSIEQPVEQRTLPDIKEIQEDTVVFLLPHFTAGNGDLHPTVFGVTFGGFIQASAISGVLSNHWVIPLFDSWHSLLIINGIVFAILWALSKKSTKFCFAISMALVSSIALGGVLLFVFKTVDTPWLITMSVSFIVALTNFLVRVIRDSVQNEVLREELAKDSPKEVVEYLMSTRIKGDFIFEAREFTATVMFLDIAGFSKWALTAPSKKVGEVASVPQKIAADIITKHGGIYNKGTGDGFLAYFGHNFVTQKSVPGHEQSAVSAALEIATEFLRMLKKYRLNRESEEILHPFRIGLNSGSVVLNTEVGPTRVPSFTIMGNAVNYGKRMEAAASENCVMLGESVWKNIAHDGLAAREKLLHLKGHVVDQICYELQPMVLNGKVKEEFVALAKAQFERRVDKRIDIRSLNIIVSVANRRAFGRLLNISSSGVSFEVNECYSSGSVVRLELDCDDVAISLALHRNYSGVIAVKICYVSEECSHGMSIHGGTVEDIGSRLHDLCCGFLLAQERNEEGRS